MRVLVRRHLVHCVGTHCVGTRHGLQPCVGCLRYSAVVDTPVQCKFSSLKQFLSDGCVQNTDNNTVAQQCVFQTITEITRLCQRAQLRNVRINILVILHARVENIIIIIIVASRDDDGG